MDGICQWGTCQLTLSLFSWSTDFKFCQGFVISISTTIQPRLTIFGPQLSSEWLLFKAKSAIFQLFHGENKFFQLNDDDVLFVLDQHAELAFYSASSLKQQSGERKSLYSDTLFWFRANQSLPFLLNAACLVEKQQIPIL